MTDEKHLAAVGRPGTEGFGDPARDTCTSETAAATATIAASSRRLKPVKRLATGSVVRSDGFVFMSSPLVAGLPDRPVRTLKTPRGRRYSWAGHPERARPNRRADPCRYKIGSAVAENRQPCRIRGVRPLVTSITSYFGERKTGAEVRD